MCTVIRNKTFHSYEPIYEIFLKADTTHGTNNEKKELFTIASLDGNQKAFNVCRAYIPNAKSWVFTLMFN